MYFIVHAAFVHIKLMMMMMIVVGPPVAKWSVPYRKSGSMISTAVSVFLAKARIAVSEHSQYTQIWPKHYSMLIDCRK